ncbi:'Cold-shock' DNA-binding domain protein [bacterium BMS3Abin02]|nr:'Cold-shock' DNA-binding domain protein [bacterium BMS3Abin02]GBE23526.1 'Cold-shock' DNA-binding domain protein [bacterium BMS3Bbin01]HDH27203.1 cold-shock protein [Actinomycetota bacterium]HDK45926.1 cold-shock protein [Actinomycetota bacterium]HDL48619.1 cold-shock protein [Actinomycetota bacterium]
MQGVVKLFDPSTGLGIVVCDTDRTEVLLDGASLDGSIFRNLRQGQRIIFDIDDVDGNATVRQIRVGSEGT